MESDRLLLFAGLTTAALLSVIAFWGPDTDHSKNSSLATKKRGRLAGLRNLGKTCFLNTILQALAACPLFVEWLKRKYTREDSLSHHLSTVLSIINGANVEGSSRSFAPIDVLKALKNLGYLLQADEQDAHELFHILLQSLEKEISKPYSNLGSISDILALEPEPEQDSINDDQGVQTPDDFPPSFPDDGCFSNPTSLSTGNLMEGPQSLYYLKKRLSRKRSVRYQSYRSLPIQELKCSKAYEHPFTGTLTSQLKCTTCGSKSTVRYDKFDSISLSLPPYDPTVLQHKLEQLLHEFVNPEIITDVQCDLCSQNNEIKPSEALTKQIKSLNFGKLPKCLCIHISRNVWHSSIQKMTKRLDYVQFPFRLSLNQYTYLETNYSSLKRRLGCQSSSEGGSPLTNVNSASWNGNNDVQPISKNWNYIYQLAAVVVHTGGNANTGHFITYRRGYGETSQKWYLTSDIEIREATREEVFNSTAYMLFYEKLQFIN